jgi:hypothetical protein
MIIKKINFKDINEKYKNMYFNLNEELYYELYNNANIILVIISKDSYDKNKCDARIFTKCFEKEMIDIIIEEAKKLKFKQVSITLVPNDNNIKLLKENNFKESINHEKFIYLSKAI